jgi:hypothetical protein
MLCRVAQSCPVSSRMFRPCVTPFRRRLRASKIQICVVCVSLAAPIVPRVCHDAPLPHACLLPSAPSPSAPRNAPPCLLTHSSALSSPRAPERRCASASAVRACAGWPPAPRGAARSARQRQQACVAESRRARGRRKACKQLRGRGSAVQEVAIARAELTQACNGVWVCATSAKRKGKQHLPCACALPSAPPVSTNTFSTPFSQNSVAAGCARTERHVTRTYVCVVAWEEVSARERQRSARSVRGFRTHGTRAQLRAPLRVVRPRHR